MNRFTKPAFFVCVALAASAVSQAASAATLEEKIAARLDALEKENAALKQRLKRVEGSVATSRQALPPQPAGTGTLRNSDAILDARAQDNRQVYKSAVIAPSGPLRHWEVSGSLLFLQPGAGNLEYATLVSPFPLPTPHWTDQLLTPNFSPAFRFGLRYIPSSPTISNWIGRISTPALMHPSSVRPTR